MSASWKGSFILTEDARNDIEIDKYGVSGGTEYYWGPFDQAIGFVLGKTQHPSYEWLLRKTATINREEADYSQVRITYAGVPPNTREVIYKTTGSTSGEPIETHPNFITKIAGKPGAALNGALFVGGKFTGFSYPTDKITETTKYGVKSFLSPGLNYEESVTLGDLEGEVNLGQLGKIMNPPESAVFPDLSDGEEEDFTRTWLLVGGTAEIVGLGGKTSRTWKLSGRRGWDTEIYSW